MALTAGVVMSGLCLAQLVAAGGGRQLCLLLLLTAAPDGARRGPPAGRPAGGAADGDRLPGRRRSCWRCPTASAPVAAAVLLTVLYGVAMAVGAALDTALPARDGPARRRCAAVAAVLLLAADGDGTVLAAVLAVQGACTLGWAWRTGGPTRTTATVPLAWRAARPSWCWPPGSLAAAGDLPRVEWYSLPAAAGLLIAAGPRLPAARRGRRGGRGCWWPRCRRPCWR